MQYRALNQYLREKFCEKIYKISVDIGSTCPNRDGKYGGTGCIFCNPESVVTAVLNEKLPSIGTQICEGAKYVSKRHGAAKYIAYFQNFSNTYGPIGKLKEAYFDAARSKDVVGVAISTRPDCLQKDILDVLEELNKETYLWVELGLQSASNDMLSFLNRRHSVEVFVEASENLHKRGVEVCAHVILGLPKEKDEDLEKIVYLINENKIEGIKIHNLLVLKNTKLEELYNRGEIEIISLAEYARRVAFLIERLSPGVVIHRFNSHSPRDLTVAPKWSVNKLATFNAVEKELRERGTCQGKKFSNLTIGYIE